eukprot:1480111-Alexandrium_andersonii.AAC.1
MGRLVQLTAGLIEDRLHLSRRREGDREHAVLLGTVDLEGDPPGRCAAATGARGRPRRRRRRSVLSL